jgi:hypothetical protein
MVDRSRIRPVGGEEQQVADEQFVDSRMHRRRRVLVVGDPRQDEAGLLVGPLHKTRTVEEVRARGAPHVLMTQLGLGEVERLHRFRGGGHAVDRAADVQACPDGRLLRVDRGKLLLIRD